MTDTDRLTAIRERLKRHGGVALSDSIWLCEQLSLSAARIAQLEAENAKLNRGIREWARLHDQIAEELERKDQHG